MYNKKKKGLLIMLTYIDTGSLQKVKGNTYYLKETGLYYLIENDTIKKCWREYYDDFGELSYKYVDIKHAMKTLIDLEIGFE